MSSSIFKIVCHIWISVFVLPQCTVTCSLICFVGSICSQMEWPTNKTADRSSEYETIDMICIYMFNQWSCWSDCCGETLCRRSWPHTWVSIRTINVYRSKWLCNQGSIYWGRGSFFTKPHDFHPSPQTFLCLYVIQHTRFLGWWVMHQLRNLGMRPRTSSMYWSLLLQWCSIVMDGHKQDHKNN